MTRWLRTIWYVLTLRCEEADRLRAIERDAELTRAQRLGESMHRMLCGSCRKARRQARALSTMLADLEANFEAGLDEAGPKMSEAMRTRIAAQLEASLDADTKNSN